MTDRPILFSAPMIRALLDGRKTQTRRIIKPQPFIDKMGNFCTPREQGGHWNWGQQFDGRPCVRNFVDQQIRMKRGDRLWAKETWRPHSLGETSWDIDVVYAADSARRTINDGDFGDNDWTWPKAADRGNVSSLFMPRWASRITLIVTDVRVERLQDISETDAVAEGCFKGKASGRVFENQAAMHLGGNEWANGRDWFADLWDSINAKPAPVKGEDGKVSHYIGHPWEGEPRTETYRGKPHHISPNPWVAAYTFTVVKQNIDQIDREAA
jgi:hypothetical protein